MKVEIKDYRSQKCNPRGNYLCIYFVNLQSCGKLPIFKALCTDLIGVSDIKADPHRKNGFSIDSKYMILS